jgi:hypothetical protein
MCPSRHAADMRKALNPLQPAATEVHAVHAELTRRMGQRHRRGQGAKESATTRLRCAQYRNMAAAPVQIKQPGLLLLFRRAIQQAHGNQQRTLCSIRRFVVSDYPGQRETRRQRRQPDRPNLPTGNSESIDTLCHQRSADLRPSQFLLGIISLVGLGQTIERRQQQRLRPSVGVHHRCGGARHRPRHVAGAEAPVDRRVDLEIPVAGNCRQVERVRGVQHHELSDSEKVRNPIRYDR